MPAFALKVVPGSWEIEQPLPFTEAEYQLHRDKMEPGTRVVIYQGAPVNGVVAEGQVNQSFIHVDEWKDSLAVNLRQKNYPHLLPVQILYQRAGPAAVMPLARVREILGDTEFPRPGQEWIVLENQQYHLLIQGWT
jgi:hypothetical protein